MDYKDYVISIYDEFNRRYLLELERDEESKKIISNNKMRLLCNKMRLLCCLISLLGMLMVLIGILLHKFKLAITGVALYYIFLLLLRDRSIKKIEEINFRIKILKEILIQEKLYNVKAVDELIKISDSILDKIITSYKSVLLYFSGLISGVLALWNAFNLKEKEGFLIIIAIIFFIISIVILCNLIVSLSPNNSYDKRNRINYDLRIIKIKMYEELN